MAALVFRILCILFLTVTPPPPSGAEAEATLVLAQNTGTDQPLTVGDVVVLTLEVRHPAGSRVAVPDLREAWKDTPALDVRAQSRSQTRTDEDGSLLTTVEIRIAWFAPGEHTTPSLDVTLSDAAGETRMLIATGVTVKIESVLTPQDRTLRDLKPQAELPGPPAWLLALAAVLCLLALGGMIWFFLSRRRRRESAASALPSLPPGEEALAELARIAGLALPESGRMKEHYTLVGDCLRAYVERRFGVPALERTSAEIRSGLVKIDLPPEQANAFNETFGEGDLVKFARFEPGVDAARTYLADVRALVEKTQNDEPAL